MNCWSCEVNQRMSKMVVEMLIKRQKESMHNWLNQPMNHRMGEPMNQRMSESMKQLTNESMNQWINDSMNQCTFSTSFSNSAPTPAVFLDLKCKIELWLQSRANFANLVFQRCSEHTKFCNTNRALATVLCTFCRQLSQLEAHNRGNRDLTLATSRVTLPEKHMVSRLGMFSPATTWWWDMMRDSHYDVVGMMVWMLTMTNGGSSGIYNLSPAPGWRLTLAWAQTTSRNPNSVEILPHSNLVILQHDSLRSGGTNRSWHRVVLGRGQSQEERHHLGQNPQGLTLTATTLSKTVSKAGSLGSCKLLVPRSKTNNTITNRWCTMNSSKDQETKIIDKTLLQTCQIWPTPWTLAPQMSCIPLPGSSVATQHPGKGLESDQNQATWENNGKHGKAWTGKTSNAGLVWKRLKIRQ